MGRVGGGHGGGRSSIGHSGGGHRSSGYSGGGHRASFGTSRSSQSGKSPSVGSFGGAARTRSGPFVGPGGFNTRGMGTFNSSPTNSVPPIIINNNSGRRSSPFGSTGLGCGGFGCGGCAAGIAVLAVIIIICAVISVFSMGVGGAGQNDLYAGQKIPESSYNREKLDNSSWSNDCVFDYSGIISQDGSVVGLERKLRKFFDKTGVQPYVVIYDYDPALGYEENKEAAAEEWYQENIDNAYSFALFIFLENDADTPDYMYYLGGNDALSVMDAEAMDIFWVLCDKEWYNFNQTSEDALANIFTNTADRIMTKTKTKNDIIWLVLIIVLVIVIAAIIIIIMNKRRKHEKERNEETRKILETPLE